jgi:hypothetical protein
MRFHFVARGAIHFPAGKPANVLRGAFGATFKRMTCAETCLDSRTCEQRTTCAYARIFEPAAAGGPSGLADSPRPFVFRARNLDGCDVKPGEAFHFGMNLFDQRPEIADRLAQVVTELARQGLGVTRGQAELERVEREPHSLSLEPSPVPISKVRVDYLTPTELKSGERLAARPEFPILFARIRDRLSTLSSLYGNGPLPIDFRAAGERAAQVRLSGCEIRGVTVQRRSGRTGQTHGIGGFTGSAEYEGAIAEFLPYLEAARWTGVGRQTVWGKGEIRTTRIRK